MKLMETHASAAVILILMGQHSTGPSGTIGKVVVQKLKRWWST